MDKTLIKEIFLLAVEVIKALFEILWKKIKGLISFIRNKFLRLIGVSPQEQVSEQEWGFTGEDTWPSAPETAPEEPHYEITTGIPPTTEFPSGPEEKQRIEKAEIAPAPPIPELPKSYGDNRIVLMMRDPSCLFTYWELRRSVIDNVLNTLGPLANRVKMVLRVYNVTDSTFTGKTVTNYFDIEVPDKAQSWYIHVEPNRSFFVDIGFLSPNGTFRILSRSNLIKTPCAGVSQVIDEKWVYIKEFYEKEYTFPEFGSEFALKRAHKDQHQIHKEGALPFESSNTLTTPKG
jgi:uncharacterized protein